MASFNELSRSQQIRAAAINAAASYGADLESVEEVVNYAVRFEKYIESGE